MTELLLEALLETGVKTFKKKHRNEVWGRKIDRHEVVTIDGVDFRFWRELAVYSAGDCIRECIPEANVEVFLDGNDSVLSIEVDDMEEKKLVDFILKAFIVCKVDYKG